MPMTSASTTSSAQLRSSSAWTSTSTSRSSAARLAVQRGDPLGVERRDDQQQRVGARGRGLVDLIGVDDEVLAQDRQDRRRAGGAQVVERAAEVRPLGEDRERGRAAALVGADDLLDRRARRGSRPPTASGACARRSPTPRAGSAPRERALVASVRAAPRARPAAPGPGGGAPPRASRRRSAPARSPRARQLLAEADVALQRPGRRAGVDRLARRRRTPASSDSARARGVDRGAGVEHGQVATAGPARRRGRARVVCGVLGGRPAGDVLGSGEGQPERLGLDRVALDGVGVDLDDVGRRRRCSSRRAHPRWTLAAPGRPRGAPAPRP